MTETPIEANKPWLRGLIVAVCSIPFLVKLPFYLYFIIGCILGFGSVIVADILHRWHYGHGLLTEVFLQSLKEADVEQKFVIQASESKVKALAAVVMFTYSMLTHSMLWPGILVVKLLSRSFPSLGEVRS